MYDHFTDRARIVMRLANQEAERGGREYIGPEHLLLGLLDSRSGIAAHFVETLGGGACRLRGTIEKFEKLMSHGPDAIPSTPRAKKVIERSIEEARNLNHDRVGTQHVLLAILHEPNEPIASAFATLGLDARLIREHILLAIRSKASDDAPLAQ